MPASVQIRTQCEDGRVIISDRRLSRAELRSAEAELDAAHARADGAARDGDASEQPFGESPSGSSSSSSESSDEVTCDPSGEDVAITIDEPEPEVPSVEELERRKVARGPPGWGPGGPNAAAPHEAPTSTMQGSRDGDDAPASAGPAIGAQEPQSASAAQRKQADIDSLAGLRSDVRPRVGSLRSHALTSSDEPIEHLDALPPEEGEAGSIKAFLYGVQDALVRQAATAVAAPTRVRVVSHIKVRWRSLNRSGSAV